MTDTTISIAAPSPASQRFVDEYKTAMRHVASQVAVVTYARGEDRGGITCTAICSASTEPPALVVCINRSSPARDGIARAGAFAVNHLTDEQSEIARAFSQSSQVAAPFDLGQWSTGSEGAPILAQATANFECRIDPCIEIGGHTMFIGWVVAVQTAPGSTLLYRDGFFRRLSQE